jgi:thiamine biosynthesis lipoprotein
MGTEVTVLAPAAHVTEATDRARRLFDDWERRLSRFLPDSELARLNVRAGRPVVVGELLYQVLETALQAAQATGGVYDPFRASWAARLRPLRRADRPGRHADGTWGQWRWRRVRMDSAHVR